MKALRLLLLLYGELLQILIASAQGTSCQVYPTECTYSDTSVNASAWDRSNQCQRYTEAEVPGGINFNQYLHCNHPTKLTDSNLGSIQHIQQDTFYIWNKHDGTILFTFSEPYTFTQIKLHYYSSSGTGLPSVTFYVVPEDYMIWSHLPTSSIGHILQNNPSTAVGDGMWVATLNVLNTASKLAMYVSRSSYQFYLSEVEFFTCRVQVAQRTQCDTPPTNEGCQTPSSPDPITTTNNAPHHNETEGLTVKTTTMTSDDTTLKKHENQQISTTTISKILDCENGGLSLSWVLVGVLGSALCLWALANIACLGLYVRHVRHKRYKVETNPSYAFSSPVYNIEEHVYDTPAS